jgi:hypothetical protein
MSKNVTDSVLELNSDRFGLLPTRRQIEFDGGYVNNWDTKTFYEYVRNKSNVVLERDHAGPHQGTKIDNGYDSYKHDAKYFDIIHIDPWKLKLGDIRVGAEATVRAIRYLYELNPNLKFEVGTEQAIREFNIVELTFFINYLQSNLTSDMFEAIEYVVIQSGVGINLEKRKNIAIFDENRLKEMVYLVKLYNKKTKEHNGDYLSNDELKLRFDLGVDSINIGPEIVQYETLLYLEHMTPTQIDEYYQICLESKRWERWVSPTFDLNDKHKLIQICGHYCFHLYDLPNIDELVKTCIKDKLNSLP